ncbi:MAG: ABC transporter ATP-binding protein [Gammaproteobacteria bacterium]|nr:ABC transporter ATP-binding protein [Gammaproteobacteria bacterium]
MTLRLDQVGVRYGDRQALRSMTLELEPGGLVGLVGPNGAGKSSLLKAVAGVVPAAGSVTWRGMPLAGLEPRERARTVAYLPQSPAAHWPMKAADVVALGRLPHRDEGRRHASAKAAAAALERCDAAGLAERRIDELSGGERARVLLARTLAVEAPVLLVDEPIQSLDPYHQLGIMQVLRGYAGPDTLVVAVLHDLTLAARFCTRTVLLHDGAVVGDGAPETVLAAGPIERYYRVRPYLGRFDGATVVVPWTRLDRRD